MRFSKKSRESDTVFVTRVLRELHGKPKMKRVLHAKNPKACERAAVSHERRAV